MRHIVIKQSLVYGGRRYFVGDAVELSKKDAKTLAAIRAVVKAPLLYAEPRKSAPVEIAASEGEGADASAATETDNRAMTAEPVEISERTGKPKRPYTRRDLSSEQ